MGVNSVLPIDLSTDPDVRDFVEEISKRVDATEEVKECAKQSCRALPITKSCGLFTGTKDNLRQRAGGERAVLRDAYFITAVWPLLGAQIMLRGRSPESQLAILHAVYVGAVRLLEQIFDDRQVEHGKERETLSQVTLRGDECIFEPESTVEAFTCCLRYATDSLRTLLS